MFTPDDPKLLIVISALLLLGVIAWLLNLVVTKLSNFLDQWAKLRAVKNYTREITRNPGDSKAYLGRGNAYFGLGERHYLTKALADYDYALKLKPDYAEAFYRRGNVWLQLQEYRRAVEDYDKALELAPNHFWAYVMRGHSYLDLEEYEQAISDYTRSLELVPGYRPVYIGRSLAYSKIGEYKKSQDDYEKGGARSALSAHRLLGWMSAKRPLNIMLKLRS